MPPFNWLDQNAITELFQVTLEILQEDAGRRKAFLRNIHPGWVGGITTPGADVITQLFGDLDSLNREQRLLDGTVPLRIWLGNASLLARAYGKSSATVYERYRDDIAGRAEMIPASVMPMPVAPEGGKEVVINDRDFLSPRFLQRGAELARAVGKMEVPRFFGGAADMGGQGQNRGFGTGWLIAPGYVLTNHHVIDARQPGEGHATDADWALQGKASKIRFDFDGEGEAGTLVPVAEIVAFDKTLDYALLKLASAEPARGWFREAATVTTGATANIIQHPSGQPKQVAVRNNLIHAVANDTVQYFTDTEGGSSGSPVCNDAWEVVALHRAWKKVAGGVVFQGKTTFYVNEGAVFGAIRAHLEKQQLWQPLVAARS